MKYRAGYKYQLVEDIMLETDIRPDQNIISYFVDLLTDGILTVRRGYAWDGPSGPTYDTENAMTPSCYHDAMYQLMREGLLPRVCRSKVDYEFEKMLEARGMWWLRRKLWMRAVRHFATAASRSPRPVMVAP
jgi:hypothetical protein